MNILSLQKKVVVIELFIKKANRALMEFEVAQSKWEAKKKIGKFYATASSLVKDVTRKTTQA
jgi:hypothetical protein